LVARRPLSSNIVPLYLMETKDPWQLRIGSLALRILLRQLGALILKKWIMPN